jgi:hypothetical protein
MNLKGIFLLLLAVVALSACATIPTGPSVMVWPGPGKPFEVFQSDDAVCRQWASQQVGMQASESANQTLASGAAAGTILGAGLGAAMGAASGHAGPGLAVGAVSGAILGTAAASGPASGAQWEVQRRYDNAYMQCMYFKGNQVPGVVGPSRQAVPPPPPPPGFTPPPSGAYPPPATGEPGTGNISPPPTTSQITPNPNQKRCQKWAPTGEYHNESRWNPQKQMMETVSVPNFAWQDYPCE